jgi:SAM-dependent methyltransferase
MRWLASLLPRIHAFVPAATILEIAPGFGRWTQFLRHLCDRLIVVDSSEKCIRACEERFAACSHIDYHANDGKSLAMVPDRAIDFVFSFDSLARAEEVVIQEYLTQLANKLTADGARATLQSENQGERSTADSRARDRGRTASAMLRLSK